MATHVYIAGIDYGDKVLFDGLSIEQVLTQAVDTCSFRIRDVQPHEGEEVRIVDDTIGLLFAGIIDNVRLVRDEETVKVWEVKAQDYTYLLDRKLVVETYENVPADEIVRDIIAKYGGGVFTTNHVQSGAPAVELIVFDYKRPSECFKELADYVGWDWFVDYQKDIWFFNPLALNQPAPMALEPAGRFRNLKHNIETTGLRNRVYVRGGTMLSDPQTIQWKADGVARIWNLPWGPHEVSFKVGEVLKTVGVENLHDEADFDYMMNFQEKYIRCSAQTSTPVEGTTISLTARQDIPVITMVEDYASQAAIAKVQGGDGVYEHVIDDDSLTTIQAAEAAGMADLREHANPRVKGSFETEFSTPLEIVERLIDEAAVFTRTSKAYLSDGTEVAAGVPRFERGKFGQAVMVEAGTTNVFVYPTFDTASVDGGWYHWGAIGHIGTYGQNTDPAFIFGNKFYSHWVENAAGATGDYLMYQLPSLGGQPGYSSIIFVCCMADGSPVTNDKCYPTWNGRDGGAPNNQWTSIKQIGTSKFYECRVDGIHQSGTGGVNDLIGVYVKPGNKVYFSRAQCERKPYATSFVDGTRSPETLTIPTAGVLNPQEGTVEITIIPQNNYTGRAQIHFEANAGTENKSQVFIWNENGYWRCGLYDKDGVRRKIDIPYDGQQGVPTRIAITWKNCNSGLANAEVKVYKNGELKGVIQNVQINLESAFTVCSIGRRAVYADFWGNALYDDLRISSRARTDEEIAAAYASGQPLPVDEHTTLKMPFNNSLDAFGCKIVHTYWQPGQIVEINLPDRGIQGEYLIQRVTITPATPEFWTFRVEYGGRLLGIADFLKALVSAQQKKKMAETAIISKFDRQIEIAGTTDEVTAIPRNLPYRCGDPDALCGFVQLDNGGDWVFLGPMPVARGDW